MAEKKNKTLEKARKEMTYLTGDEEIRRLENAKKMKEKNIPIETIVEITVLTKEKIEKL